ncbi:sugar MFS transporter [Ohtaekwangia koreensis]|uniref:MFS transporter, FHS family, L-fucose permease n=1 Tax=Ohtaekwangia koreensis TaxID=688867 RepID=A0A1T5M7F2_9BACT|nr:sugar MFS transporter [Ohtaekwangia koreensis]SKC84167.1 MFS transporter, FHS family, L-fucose permease [Ohtaekwangia koreensis]
MASIISSSTASSNNEKGNYTLPLIILTTLFFMWGFITCMNDILIPYLQGIFKLTPAQAGFIQSAFFGAYFFVSLIYFLVSINLGDPLAKIGYKNGIIVGLITAAIGCCLFYPAAESKAYGIFLLALFVLAGGITILQMAANPYVALLGNSETSSSRLTLTQAFNSFGTTIAPIIGGKLIFKSVGGKEHMTAEAVKTPYLFLAATLIALAVIISLSKLPRFTGEKIEKGLEVLKFSHLTLGVIGIFMYVGGEVAIGSYLVKYFDELLGFKEATAATYVAFYWGGAMVGRFIGAISLTNRNQTQKFLLMAMITLIAVVAVFMLMESVLFALIILGLVTGNCIAFILGKSVPAKTLAIFSIIVVGLLITTVFTSGAVAMWSVLAIGLFNSIMFPTIFTLAIKDLGKYTSQGSSLLVMAIVGGAVLTPVTGIIVGAIGYQKAFLFPIICYLFIFYYGVKGHEVKRKASA